MLLVRERAVITAVAVSSTSQNPAKPQNSMRRHSSSGERRPKLDQLCQEGCKQKWKERLGVVLRNFEIFLKVWWHDATLFRLFLTLDEHTYNIYIYYLSSTLLFLPIQTRLQSFLNTFFSSKIGRLWRIRRVHIFRRKGRQFKTVFCPSKKWM